MRFIVFVCFLSLLVLFSCKQVSEKESSQLETETVISLMEYDLERLEKEILELGNYTLTLLQNREEILRTADPNKYKFDGFVANSAPNADPELSTIYLSLLSPDREKAKELVLLTNSLDDKYKAILKEFPMVSQVYFNSGLQVNRLYPPYDANAMLEPNLDVTKFNFYYEADEVHNPSGNLVWLDEIYIDPVGKGWMISLLHPVYYQNKLQMVFAFDITVNDIISYYIDKTSRPLLIVDATGTVVAGKARAIEALSLPPLKNHTYTQTITSDSFRMDDFNLFKSKNQEVRKMASQLILAGQNSYTLHLGSELHKVNVQKMKKLNWYVIDLGL